MVVPAKRLVRRWQGTTTEIDSRFSFHGTLTPPWESKKKRREDSPTQKQPRQTGPIRGAAMAWRRVADSRADADAADLCRRDRTTHRRGLLLDLVEGKRALFPGSPAWHRLVHLVWHSDLRRHQSRRAVCRHTGNAGHAIAARRYRPARD